METKTQPKTETKLVIRRQWNNPVIEVFISKDEVGLKMNLNDFIHALVEEVGNPTFIVTKNGLKKRLLEKADWVLTNVKQESARVV
jgi:hypothetical protein